MKVPKYVVEIMERAKYEFDCFKNNPDYAAGYTIKIRKSTAYTKVDTFKAEIDFPNKTHYVNQVATITIFDPVMKHIEQYIA